MWMAWRALQAGLTRLCPCSSGLSVFAALARQGTPEPLKAGEHASLPGHAVTNKGMSGKCRDGLRQR